ncbi:MAG: prephenate dehydrogenase/arogenate dehydrogenase family protein [Thiobacillaceae bacterium]
MPLIERLAVVGTGLIGGSFALALKQAGQVGSVVGAGRSDGNLQTAKARGILDQIAASAAEAVTGADFVLLAVPVGQMEDVMQAIAPALAPDVVISDVGSTKQDVVAMARTYLTDSLGRFVPGHPIAGAETSGAGAARADLFGGRNVVLTPLPDTNFKALVKTQSAWQACGAKVSLMQAGQHDRIFAAVSHLPHLLAYALVDMLAARADSDLLFNFAASGFRDFTRIAASSPEMWRDIALANKHALQDELDAYEAKLEELKAALSAEDGDALIKIFSRARQARSALREIQ